MGKKVPLYVTLKNVESLHAAEPLLEDIELQLAALEARRPVRDCRVTVEGSGPYRVHVVVGVPDLGQSSSSASDADICAALEGAFGSV